MQVTLAEVAHARSGDKGDRADLGLFADDEATYELLVRQVTADRVAAHFAPWLWPDPATRPAVPVRRWELPNLLALKFVLEGALQGGAARSLRSDNLGKTLAAALLRLSVELPDDVETVKKV